jgi:hypothetical protein
VFLHVVVNKTSILRRCWGHGSTNIPRLRAIASLGDVVDAFAVPSKEENLVILAGVAVIQCFDVFTKTLPLAGLGGFCFCLCVVGLDDQAEVRFDLVGASDIGVLSTSRPGSTGLTKACVPELLT